MNKLTIEHIAKHLPYDLKYYMEDLKGNSLTWTLGIETDLKQVLENQNKPILRPMSDLENSGYMFDLAWMGEGKKFEDYFVKATNIEMSYVLKVYNWLLKNHFDVDNLISKGLAIDVNTLENNPYD